MGRGLVELAERMDTLSTGDGDVAVPGNCIGPGSGSKGNSGMASWAR